MDNNSFCRSLACYLQAKNVILVQKLEIVGDPKDVPLVWEHTLFQIQSQPEVIEEVNAIDFFNIGATS